LLAIAYGRAIDLSVLGNVQRASKSSRAGDVGMAAMHIALAKLPKLVDPVDAARRLYIGAGLIELFDRLWELADRTESCFAWPALGRGLAVTNRALAERIPSDMAGIGPPYVCGNGAQLVAAIFDGVDPGDPVPVAAQPNRV
jgi:hypothetical protein